MDYRNYDHQRDSDRDREIREEEIRDMDRRRDVFEMDIVIDKRKRDDDAEKAMEVLREGDFAGAMFKLGQRNVAINSLEGASSCSTRKKYTPNSATAGEQFRKHLNKLLFYLQVSEALPIVLRQEWITHIEQLEIEQPASSLDLLNGLSESYLQAARSLKPHFSDLSHAMAFETQVPRIGHEIDLLLDILKHVLAIEEVNLLMDGTEMLQENAAHDHPRLWWSPQA